MNQDHKPGPITIQKADGVTDLDQIQEHSPISPIDQQSGSNSNPKSNEEPKISFAESETIQTSQKVAVNSADNLNQSQRPSSNDQNQVDMEEEFRTRFDTVVTENAAYIEIAKGHQLHQQEVSHPDSQQHRVRDQEQLAEISSPTDIPYERDKANQLQQELAKIKDSNISRLSSGQIESARLNTLKLLSGGKRLSGGAKTGSGKSNTLSGKSLLQHSGQSGNQSGSAQSAVCAQNNGGSGQSGCMDSQELTDQGNISQDQIIGHLESEPTNKMENFKLILNGSISERTDEENDVVEDQIQPLVVTQQEPPQIPDLDPSENNKGEALLLEPTKLKKVQTTVVNEYDNFLKPNTDSRQSQQVDGVLKARQTLGVDDLYRDVTFQQIDPRTQMSSTRMVSEIQTVGRQTSHINAEEFDGYEKAILKSSSFQKKRTKRKQDLDQSQHKMTGIFGCCAGLNMRKLSNEQTNSRDKRPDKPIESPMPTQFRKIQEMKLENDERKDSTQQLQEQQEFEKQQHQMEVERLKNEEAAIARKEMLKQISQKRKYSVKEIGQQKLLEQHMEKIRISNPIKIQTKPLKEADSLHFENPFMLAGEETCADPTLSSPLFGQSFEKSFDKMLDSSEPTQQNNFSDQNIDYPKGEGMFVRSQDHEQKNVTFSLKRQSTTPISEETPTELDRMRSDPDRMDSEEQGHRKDSIEQVGSIPESNDGLNQLKLIRIQNSQEDQLQSQIEKNKLTQLIVNSNLNDVIVSDDGAASKEHIKQQLQAAKSTEIPANKIYLNRRISDLNSRSNTKGESKGEFQSDLEKQLKLRKQSTNKIGNNMFRSSMVKFDLEQYSSPEVDNIFVQNQSCEQFQKPISDDASSYGTSSKSDTVIKNQLVKKTKSYNNLSGGNPNSSIRKDSFLKDSQQILNLFQSKSPPRNDKQKNNSDPYSYDVHSQSSNFNREFAAVIIKSANQDEEVTRNTQIPKRYGGIFKSINGSQEDAKSRGKLSDGKVNHQVHKSIPKNILGSTSNQGEQIAKLAKVKSIDDFQIIKKLGQGAYGKVYLATYNDQEYSIKKLSKEFLIKRSKVQNVFRERDILIGAKNFPFLPDIHKTFDDEENVHIVMEYIPNGTMQDFLKKHVMIGFKKDIVQFYAAQIVIILEYLQKLNVAHRDIKPENIMLAGNNYLKLIDFGEAKIVDAYESEDIEDESDDEQQNVRQSMNRRTSVRSDATSAFFRRVAKKDQSAKKKKQPKTGTFVGTSLYQAPEMVSKSQSGLYTDLWALGCIIFEMTFGKKMFGGKNMPEVFMKIQNREFKYPKTDDQNVIDLIDRLTEMNPHQRIGLKDIDAIKNHKYFEGVDFEAINSQLLPCPSITISQAPIDGTLINQSNLQKPSEIPDYEVYDGSSKNDWRSSMQKVQFNNSLSGQHQKQSTIFNNQQDTISIPIESRVDTPGFEEEDKDQQIQEPKQIDSKSQTGNNAQSVMFGQVFTVSDQGMQDWSMMEASNDQTTRIHIIQDEEQSKVIKMSVVKRRHGKIIKSYKLYEMYLLQNGLILFYDLDENSKTYLKEKTTLRLQIDETMFVQMQSPPKQVKKPDLKQASNQKMSDKILLKKLALFQNESLERFSLRLNSVSTYIESMEIDKWPETFQNFTFKS